MIDLVLEMEREIKVYLDKVVNLFKCIIFYFVLSNGIFNIKGFNLSNKINMFIGFVVFIIEDNG